MRVYVCTHREIPWSSARPIAIAIVLIADKIYLFLLLMCKGSLIIFNDFLIVGRFCRIVDGTLILHIKMKR